ncbi:MAG: RNA polymerase factor sigma-54 [Deltaproteobacteria bacterium]
MTTRQRFEQRQKAAFSQSLRQTIKALELPVLELRRLVEAELQENPVLEEVQPPASAADSLADRLKAASAPEDENDYAGLSREVMPGEIANYERPVPGRRETLTESLLRQLRINAKDEKQMALGMHLIMHINENGYLSEEIQTPEPSISYTRQEFEETLDLIQTFDPPGVGARDLKECLLIQLARRGEKDALLMKLVKDYIDELAEHHFDKICRKLKCSRETLAAKIHKIHSLEPKPGRVFATDDPVYVIPDVFIEEKDGELAVVTDDEKVPVIRVSASYRGMLRTRTVDETTKEFIREKIKNATRLIHAIRTRRDTIRRVVGLLADIQREAILEGMEKLKPLSLKEIAFKTGLHESTVSRIVMNKYVQTPIGIFPLRDFFSTGMKNAAGEDVSAERLRCLVRDIIEEEDKTHPLSDLAVARMLADSENVAIARRTVAKYREAQNIPPASKRKQTLLDA